MRHMILTGSLMLALSATAMAGQVYKWVDAQGVTHFSPQPPQGQRLARLCFAKNEATLDAAIARLQAL